MFEPGATVFNARFRIAETLGRGGITETYLAEQLGLGRRVVLKVLAEELGIDPSAQERFLEECRRLAAVDHPSVVRVLDAGAADQRYYLVTEQAEGVSLRTALGQGPLLPDRAVALLTQVAEGLAAIHARGLVHRDLRPENVFLLGNGAGPGSERARLADFGIARLVDPDPGEARVTRLLRPVGQPQYLSPEQCLGKAADARSDLYAFGVLAYEALAGALPFEGPSPSQFLAQHQTAPPRPLAEAAPHLAEHFRLCELVMRCLEKEPAKRPTSATEVAEKLAALPAVGEPTVLSESLLALPPALPHRPPAAPSSAPATSSSPAPRASGSGPGAPTEAPTVHDWLPSIAMPALTGTTPAEAGAPPGPAPSPLPAVRPMGLHWPTWLSRAGGAAALLALGVWWLLPRPVPDRVRSLLDDKQPEAALALVDEALGTASASGSSEPELAALRAVSLHHLGRHREEAAVLKEQLAPKAPEALEPRVLEGLFEDFGAREDGGPRELLRRLPSEALRQRAARVARGPSSLAQWGALRYLDTENAAAELELVELYGRSLTAERCAQRRAAARRLGQLGDPAAAPALERLKETPRTSTPERSCGQDEAASALKQLRGR